MSKNLSLLSSCDNKVVLTIHATNGPDTPNTTVIVLQTVPLAPYSCRIKVTDVNQQVTATTTVDMGGVFVITTSPLVTYKPTYNQDIDITTHNSALTVIGPNPHLYVKIISSVE